jgi:hypothetical protein
MNKEFIIEKLENLLSSYTAMSRIDHSSDIMAEPLFLSECESTSFFLDIEKEFTVDLNKLIPDLTVYSLDAVADKLFELCREK